MSESEASEASADLALEHLLEQGRWLTLQVWADIVRAGASVDRNYGEAASVGVPRLEGEKYVVPVGVAGKPGSLNHIATWYPFTVFEQVRTYPDGRSFEGDPTLTSLAPDLAAALRAGKLPQS